MSIAHPVTCFCPYWATAAVCCHLCSAARLRGNLASIQGVDSCTVAFSEGVVEVWSNCSQPVQVSALLQAVKETDDSYEVGLVSRDCYDAREQQQACPEEPSATNRDASLPDSAPQAASRPEL